MTPMEEARTSLTLSMGRHGDMDKALESAILAYLQAVAKDEGTVEAVARAICCGTECVRPEDCYAANEKVGRYCCLPESRAALTSLAPRVKA